jgi:hypothetical protein
MQHLYYLQMQQLPDGPGIVEADMTVQSDFTKMFQDMMGAFPVDMAPFDAAFKTSSAVNEKLTRAALDAAEKSVEVSTKWTKDTLAAAGEMTTSDGDMADYTKAMSGFASVQAEMAAENVAAFAEIARKLQMDSLELFLSAGKDMGAEASAAMKKAGEDLGQAAKKPKANAK